MKTIDSSYDNILKANYDLLTGSLSELKDLAKSWYKDIDFKNFDNRFVRDKDEEELKEMKKSGLTCNMFFAYLEDGKFYLLDGFNRLFTDYGNLEKDTPIYLKLITDKLADNHLMGIMYLLNMWKLSDRGRYGGFNVNGFLDRGFRLLLHSKFGIDLYNYQEYQTRVRNTKDIDVIDHYFVAEWENSAAFKTDYVGVNILMSNVNVINDIKTILKGNDYLEAPFKNYGMFLEGFARHLSHLRRTGDTNKYEFDQFLSKLYEDKKFFKKLVTMTGNDSTRKNIYHFYQNLGK